MIEALIARFGLHAAVVLGVVVAFATWDHSRVQKGRTLERAKIEKATTNAATMGKRAADKSTSGGVRGQRDPTTRDE
jgi:hypothetical protein